MSGPTVRALTIAGSDSSGGAGIQADLKTFGALGVWGTVAVTAVTAQGPSGVTAVFPIPADVVAEQIRAAAAGGVQAAKTGMLATVAITEAVAKTVAESGVARLVVDPVLRASSGESLSEDGLAHAIRDLLVPLAAIVTPNAAEAAALTGVDVRDRAGQAAAGHALCSLGARAALVTGGHVRPDAVDVLVEGGRVTELRSDRIDSPHVHGTGCVLSAALAAHLARGLGVRDAAAEAKRFVTDAIVRGAGGSVNP